MEKREARGEGWRGWELGGHRPRPLLRREPVGAGRGRGPKSQLASHQSSNPSRRKQTPARDGMGAIYKGYLVGGGHPMGLQAHSGPSQKGDGSFFSKLQPPVY